MEQDGYEQQRLPQGVIANRSADDSDLRGTERDGEQHLAEVKAERRGRVAIEVYVMRQVEAPQERDLVGQHVPDVESVVEERDGEHARDGRWKGDDPDREGVVWGKSG